MSTLHIGQYIYSLRYPTVIAVSGDILNPVEQHVYSEWAQYGTVWYIQYVQKVLYVQYVQYVRYLEYICVVCGVRTVCTMCCIVCMVCKVCTVCTLCTLCTVCAVCTIMYVCTYVSRYLQHLVPSTFTTCTYYRMNRSRSESCRSPIGSRQEFRTIFDEVPEWCLVPCLVGCSEKLQ